MQIIYIVGNIGTALGQSDLLTAARIWEQISPPMWMGVLLAPHLNPKTHTTPAMLRLSIDSSNRMANCPS